MSFKLSDKQRELLSAASQRQDRLLAIPSQLRGAAAQKVAAKLVAASLAKEVKAKAGAPIWRRDAETEQAYALKLTAAGVRAVAVDGKHQSETVGGAGDAPSPGDRPAHRGSRARSNAPRPMENAAEESRVDQDLVGATEPSRRPPRAGSKLGRLLGMLSTDKGATLEELTGATGWLPHTARAALTGLRKRGYDVRLVRGDRESAAAYRVTTPAAVASR
jgi:Protein of unknown function (DUF3489)